MNEAIKKAMEGGWSGDDYAFKMKVTQEPVPLENIWEVDGWQYDTKIFVDPAFWQALGKALGWTQIHGNAEFVCFSCGKDGGANSIGSCNHCGSHYRFDKKWLYQWHCFIDHLAEGRDADSFFKDLLQ